MSCPASPSSSSSSPPEPVAPAGLGPIRDLVALEDRHASRSFADVRVEVLAGDEEAWRVLVEKYSRFVWTVSRRLLAGAPGDREEQVQETYRRVFERLRRDDYRILRGFRGHCRFSSYLYRVIQTARSDVQRREIRHRERTEPVDFGDEVNRKLEAAMAAKSDRSEAREPTRVAAASLRREMERTVAGLEPRERVLVRLRFREGLKLRELAAALGYRDTNDAAYALRKALKRLDPGAVLGAGDWSDAERDLLCDTLREVLLE